MAEVLRKSIFNHLSITCQVSKDTTEFSTENASGSTSQAANVMEALEAQTSLLLIDEDTSATNFMIRDGRMQKLIARKEPITPFSNKVKPLYEGLRCLNNSYCWWLRRLL